MDKLWGLDYSEFVLQGERESPLKKKGREREREEKRREKRGEEPEQPREVEETAASERAPEGEELH